MKTPLRLIKLHEVIHLTAIKRSTIYKLQKSGEFPASVTLGSKSVAWNADEIDAWIEARCSVRDWKINSHVAANGVTTRTTVVRRGSKSPSGNAGLFQQPIAVRGKARS